MRTPGPWKPQVVYVDNGPNQYHVSTGKWGAGSIAVVDSKDNAEYICECVNAHDSLVAEVDRLRGALQRCLLIKQLMIRGYECQSHGEALRTDIYDDEADDCFDTVACIIHEARAALSGEEVTKFPISRWKDGKWEFVKFVHGFYEEALLEAKELQEKNPDWSYRIWEEEGEIKD